MFFTKKFSNVSLILFLLLSLNSINQIKTDLPIECKFSEIKGRWEFFISPDSFDPDITDPVTSCGHGFPNKLEKVVQEEDIYPDNYESKFILDLKDDHKVLEKGELVGDWTPLYVQGFILNYKDSVLNTNFKYYLKSRFSDEFQSDCSKTLIGWFIKDKNDQHHNWSCFYAKKINMQNKFLKNSFLEYKSKQKTYKPNNDLLFKTKYEDYSNFVDSVNNANLTWKAHLDPKFIGKSLYEVRKAYGLNKGINKVSEEEFQKYIHQKHEQPTTLLKQKKTQKPQKLEKTSYEKMLQNSFTQIKYKKLIGQEELDSEFVTDKAEILKYLNTKIEDMDENKLPKRWDWRNVGGMNFVPEPKIQGECGSCYTISTIEALESRLRIKTFNEDKTEFSIQFPLSCNFYSEGCEGGFPVLVGKFFNEFEIIPKDCFEYTGKTGKCSGYCDYENEYDRKYVVSDYGYIGKFYTGTNEVKMMKELRARGPILASLTIGSSFYSYESGVFSQKVLEQNSEYFSSTSPWDDKVEFEKEDHSILIVGYGEENGIKYWIGLNSWGNDFGENGFFRIVRGENEANIEGMGEYVNIDVYDRKTGKKLY